jgi:flagellar biosynthetic protein FlhB
MSSQNDSGEKNFEPTQQKLDESRRKGDIARAPDVSVAAAYLGLLAAMVAFGAVAVERLFSALTGTISRADTLAPTLLGPGGARLTLGILSDGLVSFLVVLLLPGLFVLAVLLAQRAIIFAPTKLQPKLSRISPIQSAKNKFGAKGLVEFGKTLIKMIAVSMVVGFYLAAQGAEILGAAALPAPALAMMLGAVLLALLSNVTLIAMAIGAFDFFWQRSHHLSTQRMSYQDMKEEHKSSEGDPHVKSQRRARGQAIAMNQMLADVPTADVIVVNPTHYAVALKWSRKAGTAPICVAKGVDALAAQIREMGSAAGVPIHSDPPAARAIHATVAVGEEIQPEHYQAIAAAIRFAEAMRKRARGQRLT